MMGILFLSGKVQSKEVNAKKSKNSKLKNVYFFQRDQSIKLHVLFVTLAYSNEQNIVTIYVDEMRVMFRYSLATWISEKG